MSDSDTIKDLNRRVRNLERALIAYHAVLEGSPLGPMMVGADKVMFDLFTGAEDTFLQHGPEFELPDGKRVLAGNKTDTTDSEFVEMINKIAEEEKQKSA